ncbi:MAG: mechanosensitive ion channel domain-containing protein [Collinsella sp.]
MELFEPILHFFEQRWVHNIIWAVILAIGTAVAAKVVSKTLNHLLNRDDNPLPASSIFINIARAVIWMIGGSFILDNCFGINANALVAALGVGGIAISLGFQDTLSNLIGGMQVTFMGIIKPGDNIEVGGVSGVVQDITWRHTTDRGCLWADHHRPQLQHLQEHARAFDALWARGCARCRKGHV